MNRWPEEVLVFARPAAFGVIVGAIYWFVSYEPAGTVLLLGFGAASALVSAVLWIGSRHRTTAVPGEQVDGDPSEGLFDDEEGRIPAPAYAPFVVGLGAAVIALGLALGPLLLLTGLVVLVIGARSWLDATMRQSDATAEADRT